jgi:uncharacterized membrane protein
MPHGVSQVPAGIARGLPTWSRAGVVTTAYVASKEASMTDSAPTPPPDPATPGPASSPHGTSTGLDPKVAGLLTYLAGWISGLILYLVEKEHREVRFHAAQSILLSVALLAVWIVLSVLTMIPVLGLIFGLFGILLGLASVGLWIYLMIQGYNLKHVRLPVIGEMAERWAAS